MCDSKKQLDEGEALHRQWNPMDSTTGASDDGEVGHRFEGAQASMGGDTHLGVDMVAAKLFGASSPPARVGGYTILRELGSGGMGVVYAAYDERLDRRVAIKLLRGPYRHGAAQARLQREAQAMARLAHPNVITVHEVGIHEAQLFVAMEFVAGKTLGAWMRERSSPRPWREVLEVFIAAGRGLAAAHDAGLVHRDFKPDNVMVGDDGRVRVMDFGLARVDASEMARTGEIVTGSSSSDRLTQTGVVMGTPAYMSLEQFDGADLDARSDQFSFCVALYEALHGERPFAGETIAQLMRALEHEEIRAARTDTSVPTWLRNVIARGLAKDRSQRWPSMTALLEALADDPAPRRRRWAAAGLIVALLGGASLAVAAQLRADARFCEMSEEHLAGIWDAERRTEVEQAILGTELSYAADTWERVETHLDAYAQAWVAARQEACEATHHGEQSSELLDLRMACLDRRLQHMQATVDELARVDANNLASAVPAVLALPSLDRCADVDALTAAVPPPEDPALAERVAALDEQLVVARAKEKAGRFDAAIELADAVVAEAETLGYEPLLARAWLRQGSVQDELGKYEDSEANLKRAFDAALAQRMFDEAVDASTHLVFLVGHQQARFEASLAWAAVADPLSRALGSIEWRGTYHNNLGVVLTFAGKYADARDHHERALSLWTPTLGPEHPKIAVSLGNLGNVALAESHYGQACDYYARALAIRERVLGPEHPRVAETLTSWGVALGLQRDYVEARGLHERALRIREQALGPDHPHVAASLYHLGNLAEWTGRHAEARALHERALAIRERAFGPEHPLFGASARALGSVARAEGRYDEARVHFQRSLAIHEKTMGPGVDVATLLTGLGDLSWQQGEFAESRDYYERALVIVEKMESPDHRFLNETRFLVARVLWELPVEQGRDRPRALALARRARAGLASADPGAQLHLPTIDAWIAERDEAGAED
jgi:tetratricopeptide (TPR) repeat protein/predicted Ser/Thr protein kinase